ncbi:hypothetical protein V5O48_008545 [Marasmius crinis-equi]|uniref:Uncharacterized protein n=1 Tax=Marasmius crinis-equi TaxID=585013 RepID=A0ABR3FDT0_9AGAR
MRLDSPAEASRMVFKIAELDPSLIHLAIRPHLKRYQIPSHVYQSMPCTHRTVIQFPRLRTLIVSGSADSHLVSDVTQAQSVSEMLFATLRLINAPDLDIPASLYDGFSVPFHRMISHSKCQLAHLWIGAFLTAQPAQLLQSLELLPGLRSLTFHPTSSLRTAPARANLHSHVFSTCLAVLRLLTSSRPLRCPNLETVVVERQDSATIRLVEATLDLAISRIKLKNLFIDFGKLAKREIDWLWSDKRVQTALTELKEVRGAKVVWKWKPVQETENPLYDHPYA